MQVDGYTLVSVRAFDRPGFDGFCRGGRKWSSKEDTLALVTPGLLAVLKAEKKMLAVDTGVELDAEALKLVGRFDLPPRPALDPLAVAAEEARVRRAKLAELEAMAAAEDENKRIAELEKRLALKPSASAPAAEKKK